jgi:hypothetical protein
MKLRLPVYLFLVLVLPMSLAAQQSIKCESSNGQRNYCGQYSWNQVQFDRQISGSPCTQGSTWGVDSRGLWVDRGCRATFFVRGNGGYPGNGGSGNQQSIKCESNNGQRNYCGQYSWNQVQFDRQISGSPCTQGSTWGVDSRGLWVDRGCRATFFVRGNGGYPGNGGSDNQQSIKCESNNGQRNYCGQYSWNQVQFDRQISGSPCTQGSTWGVDSRGLWVDRGCRATFFVREGSNSNYPGNGGWWQPNPGDTWPPSGSSHGGNWNGGGACFYKDLNFEGEYFCLRRGETRDQLSGMGDKITSIRVFGGARAQIFDDRNFTGARYTIHGSAPDLRSIPVAQKPGHTWNDRISSVRVH